MSNRVANKDARRYVQDRLPFEGSNTFGRWDNKGSRYVVYSYGSHWPLFIYTENKWYENADRRSVSTSKHRTQLHPLCETEKHPVEDMREISFAGVTEWMQRKLRAA